MNERINDSSFTRYSDNPLMEEYLSSPNAYPINSEDIPFAVDNKIRRSRTEILLDRLGFLIESSTFDTLSDRNFSRTRLFDASFDFYYEYFDRKYLDREYESFQQASEDRLNEVRLEAEEAYTLDNQIDPIPKTAYDDVLVLLKKVFHAGIPMPNFSWAEDGSLSLTWFLKEGLGTMGLYGDNIVIYSVFFEEKRQVEGVCELSDTPVLSGFLTILSNILSK